MSYMYVNKQHDEHFEQYIITEDNMKYEDSHKYIQQA